MNSVALIDLAQSLKFEDLPAPVVHEVKRRAFGAFGAALNAWRSPISAGLRRTSADFVTLTGGAQLWGTHQRVATDWAAFVNSWSVDNLDTIPALFAVAEAEKTGGRELITAIALAGEVQGLLGQVAVAIALSASKLMNLDAARTSHALALAAMGTRGTFPEAARQGVFMTLLARGGLPGPDAPEKQSPIDKLDWRHGAAASAVSDVQVEEKFLAIANPHLTRDQVERLIHRLWRLEEMLDLAEIASLLEVVA